MFQRKRWHQYPIGTVVFFCLGTSAVKVPTGWKHSLDNSIMIAPPEYEIEDIQEPRGIGFDPAHGVGYSGIKWPEVQQATQL